MKNYFLGTAVSVSMLVLLANCAGPLDEKSQLSGDQEGASQSMNFAMLINKYQQGKSARTPWAGFWWPYTSNGVAKPGSGGASAAGRYDAVRGNTHAEAWEVSYHGAKVPGIQGWWGHCNGWCASAALFPEPRAAAKVNGITFGIADIKALLAEAGMSASADYFGERVDYQGWDSPQFNDVVPDQLFLVLTSYIGNKGLAVLIDRFTGNQIWNQPLAAYWLSYPTQEDYKGAHPSVPGVYRVNMKVRLWWLDDGVAPDVTTPNFHFPSAVDLSLNNQDETSAYPYVSRTLTMELWLDGPLVFDEQNRVASSGNVIVTTDPVNRGLFTGGRWTMPASNQAWPDYMWVPYTLVKPLVDPNTPDKDHYANPDIDIEWMKKHLLAQKANGEYGVDDPDSHSVPVKPAPIPSPAASPSPGPTSPPFPPINGPHPPH